MTESYDPYENDPYKKPKRLDPPEQQKQSETLSRVRHLAITALIAIVPLVIVVGYVANLVSNFSLPQIVAPQTARVTSSASVVQGIRPLGQLTSISAQFAKAGVNVRVRWGVGNVCDVTASHTAQGTIEAGVDLTKFTDKDVTYHEAEDVFIIELPPPSLTNCIIDPIATQQYSLVGRTPVCWVDSDEMRRLASYDALNDFRDDAVEGGILERAASQTELLITSFVSGITGSDVIVTFKPGQAALPPSCRPQIPTPWSFSEGPGNWVRDD
jgi:hypothetical protein